jgi:hypothetical protein
MMFGSSSSNTIMKALLMLVLSTCTISVEIQSSISNETSLVFSESINALNRSSAAMPLAMKHPCTLYRVDYMKVFNKSKEYVGGEEEESSWVCELDPEDRVSTY